MARFDSETISNRKKHMAQVIYGLICDSGDGSCHMRWFRNKELVDQLLDDNTGEHEIYWANEGTPSATLTFPDDLDLKKCGFRFNDGN